MRVLFETWIDHNRASGQQGLEMKMTTIQIAYEVPAATVAKIETHLAETALRDINWNGVKFKIERDDFTCIANDDSADAVSLLHEINSIIRGE